MKRKFDWIFRGYVFALAVLLLWSVWTVAQTNTPASTTNRTVSAASEAPLKSSPAESKARHLRLTFGLDRIEVLNTVAPFGEPLWKYLASLIYIFLAFYVSKLLDFLTRVWLKKFAQRTETKFDDLLLEALRGPVKVIAFVIFLHIGLGVFKWPPQVQVVLSKGLIVIVAFSLTYVSLKV